MSSYGTLLHFICYNTHFIYVLTNQKCILFMTLLTLAMVCLHCREAKKNLSILFNVQ